MGIPINNFSKYIQKYGSPLKPQLLDGFVKKTFQQLFHLQYRKLHRLQCNLIRNQAMCDDISILR